jgi:hypothetical protein
VHIAAGLRPVHCLSTVLCDIKHASSVWAHEHAGEKGFAWQEGYGAFTFRRSELPEIVRYIATQEEHHRTRSFQDEYREFLDEWGVEFDGRFLW